jgi:hypothetical protein
MRVGGALDTLFCRFCVLFPMYIDLFHAKLSPSSCLLAFCNPLDSWFFETLRTFLHGFYLTWHIIARKCHMKLLFIGLIGKDYNISFAVILLQSSKKTVMQGKL